MARHEGGLNMEMNTDLKYGLADRYAQKVCNGDMTLLQVERALSKLGFAHDEHYKMMQIIRDKVSERKKGHV
jgi:hypothetical protein